MEAVMLLIVLALAEVCSSMPVTCPGAVPTVSVTLGFGLTATTVRTLCDTTSTVFEHDACASDLMETNLLFECTIPGMTCTMYGGVAGTCKGPYYIGLEGPSYFCANSLTQDPIPAGLDCDVARLIAQEYGPAPASLVAPASCPVGTLNAVAIELNGTPLVSLCATNGMCPLWSELELMTGCDQHEAGRSCLMAQSLGTCRGPYTVSEGSRLRANRWLCADPSGNPVPATVWCYTVHFPTVPASTTSAAVVPASTTPAPAAPASTTPAAAAPASTTPAPAAPAAATPAPASCATRLQELMRECSFNAPCL